ncbi:hypothetical protein CAOG_07057 [Capsaspora owczarzaki ATCC 30864]|uniref:Uncharacterized protein n=1 Tax=Capsaspora owczarzaki (strain ATCC 30864) TaxID=595528 RepID=A0A0D2X4W9_CAPO3|nr:hypothetical protein CAOG_07057 [Capsaspora owczarzaki ATCC 30864]KJE96789.1 hypothetical protein CAOG_007057 [Capsaspora owczarzaki ATCC 30864]|eukprot:XP_004343781.1 hypothetical protein CAOG_07057 [Capsaspora owczarzaki ATCC 30864]
MLRKFVERVLSGTAKRAATPVTTQSASAARSSAATASASAKPKSLLEPTSATLPTTTTTTQNQNAPRQPASIRTTSYRDGPPSASSSSSSLASAGRVSLTSLPDASAAASATTTLGLPDAGKMNVLSNKAGSTSNMNDDIEAFQRMALPSSSAAAASSNVAQQQPPHHQGQRVANVEVRGIGVVTATSVAINPITLQPYHVHAVLFRAPPARSLHSGSVARKPQPQVIPKVDSRMVAKQQSPAAESSSALAETVSWTVPEVEGDVLRLDPSVEVTHFGTPRPAPEPRQSEDEDAAAFISRGGPAKEY